MVVHQPHQYHTERLDCVERLFAARSHKGTLRLEIRRPTGRKVCGSWSPRHDCCGAGGTCRVGTWRSPRCRSGIKRRLRVGDVAQEANAPPFLCLVPSFEPWHLSPPSPRCAVAAAPCLRALCTPYPQDLQATAVGQLLQVQSLGRAQDSIAGCSRDRLSAAASSRSRREGRSCTPPATVCTETACRGCWYRRL